MKRFIRIIIFSIFTCSIAFAQNHEKIASLPRNKLLYQPMAYVNDIAITPLDLEKRINMVHLQNNIQPGTPVSDKDRIALLNATMSDILKKQELNRFSVSTRPERVRAKIGEFFAKRQLTEPQFVKLLEEYRLPLDYLEKKIAIDIGWQAYIQGRYGADITISTHEISQIIEGLIKAEGVGVNYDEIFLPVTSLLGAEKSQKTAQNILQALNKGGDFKTLQEEYNIGRAKIPNSKDFIPLARANKALHPFLLSGADGEVSSMIQSKKGLHIIRLNQRKIDDSLVIFPKVTAKIGVLPKKGRDNEVLRTILDKALTEKKPCQQFSDYFEEIEDYSSLTWREYPEGLRKYIRIMGMDESKLIHVKEEYLKILTICNIEKIDYYHNAPAQLQQSVRSRLRGQKLSLKEQEYLRKLREAAVIMVVDQP